MQNYMLNLCSGSGHQINIYVFDLFWTPDIHFCIFLVQSFYTQYMSLCGILLSGSRYEMHIYVFNVFRGSRHQTYIYMFTLFIGSRHQIYNIMFSLFSCPIRQMYISRCLSWPVVLYTRCTFLYLLLQCF